MLYRECWAKAAEKALRKARQVEQRDNVEQANGVEKAFEIAIGAAMGVLVGEAAYLMKQSPLPLLQHNTELASAFWDNMASVCAVGICSGALGARFVVSTATLLRKLTR